MKYWHVVGATLLFLAACQGGGPVETNRTSFKSNYDVARAALEKGQFDKAARNYKALLAEAGPLAPRLRLEFAHALLREGRYSRAAEEARIVASGLTGPGRAAALAVQGTAEHEAALANLERGRKGGETITLLQSAQFALQDMLTTHPDLDPSGAMQKRVQDIAITLQALL